MSSCRDVGAVRLWEREAEPEVDPQTGSLLSAQDIETLESFTDDVSGYYGRMLHWLENLIEQGVQAGKFTSTSGKAGPANCPVVCLCLQQSRRVPLLL